MLLDELFKGSVYERNTRLSDPIQIRRWWEERRLFYNKVVGWGRLSHMRPDDLLQRYLGVLGAYCRRGNRCARSPDPCTVWNIAYGIGTNICYTGGWILESLLTKSGTGDMSDFGIRAFSGGVKFPVGLTLFPAVLCRAVFLISLVRGSGPIGFPR